MRFFQRLLDTLRPGRLDRELDEEMRFHIDMRTEAYERQGLSRAEARRLAMRRFGSTLNVRERTRDVRLITWLDSVKQDAWLGLRLLRRSPALSAAAILSLALAIGATTGVFAVGDTLLIKPLPVARPHELLIPQWRSTEWPDVGVWGSNDADNNSWSFSYPMLQEFGKVPGVDIGGFQELNGAVTQIRGEAGTTDGALVTGSLFRVLGIAPASGRLITDADDRPGAPPVVVISHRLWLRSFGGDRDAVGRSIVINGQSYTVIGVAPRTFFGMQPGRWTDLYVPAAWVTGVPQVSSDSPLTNDRFWWVQLIARPKPGADLREVEAGLARRFDLLVKPHIKKPKQHATFGMRPGSRGYTFQNDAAAMAIWILAALVLLVLLIACANVANLLLARAEARRREAAMRLALGAGRLRVVRQQLTEALVLASISGVAALLLANWFADGILALAPEREGLQLDLAFGWRTAAFGIGLSMLAGLAIGVVPAVNLSRSQVAHALKAGATSRMGWARRRHLGRPLVAVQIALSMLLLVVAGLFVRSLANLHAVPLGFNPDGLVLFTLDPTAAGYSPQQKAAATERLASRLGQLAGVRDVTWSSFALLDNFSWNTRVHVAGAPVKGAPPCNLLWVGPGFHEALKIPLRAGRSIDRRDGRGAPKVAVVNEAFVAKYLSGQSPLGRTFALELEPKAQQFEGVGVVRTSKYARLRRPEQPIAFLSEAQQDLPVGPTFVLSVAGSPGHLSRDITRLVHDLEPSLPVTRVRTYREQIAQQLTMERSLSLVSSGFGVVALLLAAIGLYGIVAFAVARRTGEMGVRLALGATRRAVLRLMLKDSARVILPGAVLGMGAALAATRFVESILYGLKPTDPATVAAAMLLLLAVAAAAAYIPARRAAGIDPADALRCE